MAESIGVEEAATRLGVRQAFVRQMIAKGRLTLQDNDKLDAAQVAELGTLMARLKGDGIAAMVDAAGKEGPGDPS